MKTAIMILVSFAAVSCAQDQKADRLAPESKQNQVKKLGSVTWNLDSHKLVWVIQKGSNVNGEFVPSSEDRYEITPDQAVMAFSNEKRGFTEEEATSLRHLLDVLSLYCAESVVWWDQGQGTPLDSRGKPVPARIPTSRSSISRKSPAMVPQKWMESRTPRARNTTSPMPTWSLRSRR